MMRNEAGGLVAALILVVTLPVTTRAEAISEGIGMADVVQNRIPEQTMTVGGIIIVGNETIPHDRILDAIEVYSATQIRMADLRAAERRLARMGLFVVDSEKGVCPRVAPRGYKKGDEFADIMVTVKERPFALWRMKLADFVHWLGPWRWVLSAMLR